jgi:hypothetical protein
MVQWWRHGKSPETRFWEKVNLSNKTSSDCWEWIGLKSSKGYGVFKVDNENVSTHRYSWILHFGNIPNKLYVCHKCDNPSCVNPNHLFLGTQKDNMQDMSKKGRASNSVGTNNPRAKLSDKDVYEIRRLKSMGIKSNQLVKIFRTPLSTIVNITNNHTWKHLLDGSHE